MIELNLYFENFNHQVHEFGKTYTLDSSRSDLIMNLHVGKLENIKSSMKECLLEKINIADILNIHIQETAASICGFMYTCYLVKHHHKNVHIKVFNHDTNTSYLLNDELIQKTSNEWLRLIEENSFLRIYENSKIISVNEDYYDEIILKLIGNKPIPYKDLYKSYEEYKIPIIHANKRINHFIENQFVEIVEEHEIIHYRKIRKAQ